MAVIDAVPVPETLTRRLWLALGGTFERGAMVVPLVWLYALLRKFAGGAPFALPTVEAQLEHGTN